MVFVKDADDFQDWELLKSGSDSDSGEPFNKIDSAALVQDNYFSLDAHNRHAVDLGDDKSAESDNPSWIEPDSENLARFLNQGSDEILSDSGSERSEVRVEGMGETFGEKAGEFCLESSGMEISSPKHGDLVEKMDLGEKRIENGGDGERKDTGGVWWKMPVELLKYWVLETSSMLAVSVAAAVIAFVILSLGLCETKKKTRRLEIKVDKKVSQVMSRAARPNESYSIVKRVPVTRPSLPAVGLTNTRKNVLEGRLGAA